MITIHSSGDFNNTEKFLRRVTAGNIFNILDRYGQIGVQALARMTPQDSGETAASWSYEIVRSKDEHAIIWNNSHVVDGRPIAILIQYGHGTRNGGYVVGRDYINPALQPIFDEIVNNVWKEVTTA